jgi:hypothetical protein
MISAIEAAKIAYPIYKEKNREISEIMENCISDTIIRAAMEGKTRAGFCFTREYALKVEKWAKQFGYSAWFDRSQEQEIFYLGWNAQMKNFI